MNSLRQWAVIFQHCTYVQWKPPRMAATLRLVRIGSRASAPRLDAKPKRVLPNELLFDSSSLRDWAAAPPVVAGFPDFPVPSDVLQAPSGTSVDRLSAPAGTDVVPQSRMTLLSSRRSDRRARRFERRRQRRSRSTQARSKLPSPQGLSRGDLAGRSHAWCPVFSCPARPPPEGSPFRPQARPPGRPPGGPSVSRRIGRNRKGRPGNPWESAPPYGSRGRIQALGLKKDGRPSPCVSALP